MSVSVLVKLSCSASAASDRFCALRSRMKATPSLGWPGSAAPPTRTGSRRPSRERVGALLGLEAAGLLELHDEIRQVLGALGHDEGRPAERAAPELLHRVADEAHEGVVGVRDPAVDVPAHQRDDVGVKSARNRSSLLRSASSLRFCAVISRRSMPTETTAPSARQTG